MAGCAYTAGPDGGADGRLLYFAYGSNMDAARMRARCPAALKVGTGSVGGWRVAERLYADIEPMRGGRVWGVVWALTRRDLAALDRAEGYPFTYGCRVARVRMDGERGRFERCLVYVMSDAARADRAGRPYPGWYRAICSAGARANRIKDDFAEAKVG